MEAYSKIEIMDLDIDEDFQIMDDVFSIEKDEEMALVLEEETLCCLEKNLVGEELLSIPKLVYVNEENIQRVVTVESKETKVAGRSKKRNSDDLSSYYECEKCNKKYKSNVFFKKHVIKCGKQVTLDPHDFKLELSKCVKENIEFISNDPSLKFREPGLSVSRNAQHIISTYEKFKPSLEKWIEYLCEHIFESVNLSFMSDSKKESLFNTFHTLCTEKRYERYFLSTMEKCGLEVNKLTVFFYNQLMDAMLNSMLKYRNRKLIPVSTKPQNVELEKSEIETLRYIAGFIVFSLKKSLKKYNPFAAQISVLLECWGSKSDNDFGSSLEEYTSAWVDLVNRGGLHQVSDEFYLFIKAVEMEARTILNQELLINYCGEDLKTVLYNTFSKSENIEVCWHNITRNISNLSVKEMIKKKILLKWINIRANAFVKSWIQMIKRKGSMAISRKGEPSLRKSLGVTKDV